MFPNDCCPRLECCTCMDEGETDGVAAGAMYLLASSCMVSNVEAPPASAQYHHGWHVGARSMTTSARCPRCGGTDVRTTYYRHSALDSALSCAACNYVGPLHNPKWSADDQQRVHAQVERRSDLTPRSQHGEEEPT